MRELFNVYATMRDGVKLACDIRLPDSGEPVPAILLRTPYLKDRIPKDDLYANYEELTNAGYAVVNQDCRGTGKSEGFLDATGASEINDGYDTIEWVAGQDWCNGKVGMHGLSYFGFDQMAAAEGNPPHLAAFCPFQNGARLPFSVSRAGTFESYHLAWILDRCIENLDSWVKKPENEKQALRDKLIDYREHFSEYSSRLPAVECEITRIPELPQLKAYQMLVDGMENPNFLIRAHRPIRVEDIDRPMLFLTGWFDGALDGTMDNWKAATRHGVRTHDRRLIIGPWTHGGGLASCTDGYDFGEQNSGTAFGIHRIEREWFDYWMKGIGNGTDKTPVVRYFMLGSNTWETADCWPPQEMEELAFRLIGCEDRKGGKLAEAEKEPMKGISFVSDPADPLPSMFRDAEGRMILADPQVQYDRQDILVYRSDALTQDLAVAGNVRLRLRASVSTPDADFFARLSDVDEQGTAFPLAKGIIRCRFRNGPKAEWMTPGEVYELEIDLGHTANLFRKGHRLLLDISGSFYPAHDRNLHTRERIGFGKEMIPSVQTVEPGSKLIIPVIRR